LREIESRDIECEDIATKVASARLAKASGRKGFGNARDVRTQVIYNVPSFLFISCPPTSLEFLVSQNEL